jgi:hypothetical protein
MEDEMERRAVAVIASRVVAAYLLCCALYEVTYLPVRIYEVWHHSANVMYPSAATQGYWLNYYILNLGFGVIRTMACLMLAGFLCRFGPGVEAFFLQGTSQSDISADQP